jgi:hypothetical protein
MGTLVIQVRHHEAIASICAKQDPVIDIVSRQSVVTFSREIATIEFYFDKTKYLVLHFLLGFKPPPQP